MLKKERTPQALHHLNYTIMLLYIVRTRYTVENSKNSDQI